MDMETIVNGILEAQKEAIKQDIRANMVMINDRYFKVKEFFFTMAHKVNGGYVYNGKGFMGFPPMIGGLAAFFTDEIPDEMAFLCVESPEGFETYEGMKAENERLREENRRLEGIVSTIRNLFEENEEE